MRADRLRKHDNYHLPRTALPFPAGKSGFVYAFGGSLSPMIAGEADTIPIMIIRGDTVADTFVDFLAQPYRTTCRP
jgi:hypothetical protein